MTFFALKYISSLLVILNEYTANPLFICSFSFLAEAKCLFWVSSLKGMDLLFVYIGLKEKQLQRCYSCVLSIISPDFGRIFRNMDY